MNRRWFLKILGGMPVVGKFFPAIATPIKPVEAGVELVRGCIGVTGPPGCTGIQGYTGVQGITGIGGYPRYGCVGPTGIKGYPPIP